MIISHRANTNGANSETENHPKQVIEVLQKGFDVEVDVWLCETDLWLGHDQPNYRIDLNFLKQSGVWVHAKNKEVVNLLRNEKDIHWFWHETDQMTLTSRGYIWCFPGHEIEGGIMVDHGQSIPNKINVAGVCTDNPMRWREENVERYENRN